MTKPRIAFITTQRFRDNRTEEVTTFLSQHLDWLCEQFDVVMTGGTAAFVKSKNSNAVIEAKAPDLTGMVDVTYQLVERRLDAVIHFIDWQDKSAKPDSAVLSREANVHNVPIAHDPMTARAYITEWRHRIEKGLPLFTTTPTTEPSPLEGLPRNGKALAMIAHDNMKLELCCFAIEHKKKIFSSYESVLATGTTGGWLRRFLEASDHSGKAAKIRPCNSGPMGGDVQIAHAALTGICSDVIFFQDASVSHPHDSDIRLFEQAVSSKGVGVRLATNVESAKLLIGA